MNGESEPAGGQDRLDRADGTLQLIWFALLVGAVAVTAAAIMIAATQGPLIDGPEMPLVVALVSLVPLGLVGAFVVAPLLGRAPGAPPPAIEPAPGFFRYQALFMIRAGLLEGPAVACALGLAATGNWVLLGGAAAMIGALATLRPTRAFAESAGRQ
jgi:hypothetical protein